MKNYGVKLEVLLDQHIYENQSYSNNDFPLKKTLGLYNMIIFGSSVFHEENKYYPQVFLDKCFY